MRQFRRSLIICGCSAALILLLKVDLFSHDTIFHHFLTQRTVEIMSARYPWVFANRNVIMYGASEAPDREKHVLDNEAHKHDPSLVTQNFANGVAAFEKLAKGGKCQDAEKEGLKIMSKALHYYADQSEFLSFTTLRVRSGELNDDTYPRTFKNIMRVDAREAKNIREPENMIIKSMIVNLVKINSLMYAYQAFDPTNETIVKDTIDALRKNEILIEAIIETVVEDIKKVKERRLDKKNETAEIEKIYKYARAKIEEIYKQYILNIIALQNITIERYDKKVAPHRKACEHIITPSLCKGAECPESGASQVTPGVARDPRTGQPLNVPPPSSKCPAGYTMQTFWQSSDGRHATCCPNGVRNPRCLDVRCIKSEQCVRQN